MARVNPDGTLTASAREVLDLAEEPISAAAIAEHSGTPLFRVRSNLREMIENGLLEDRGGSFVMTELGRQRLESGE